MDWSAMLRFIVQCHALYQAVPTSMRVTDSGVVEAVMPGQVSSVAVNVKV
jgi:hypothetical protein